jgi:CheY-like chemotaxis protein
MRRGGPGGQPNQQQSQSQGQGQGHAQQQRRNHPNQRRRKRQRQPATFTGPMDHSYRLQGSENGNRANSNRQPQARFFQHPEVEPLHVTEASAQPHIFAFVDDLFFLAKIQETARKLNVKVDFVKTEQDVLDRLTGENGQSKPALVIVDLNSTSIKPLTVAHKLKARFKRDTNIIGFLSHLQGDLKMKAVEAGCDMVVPRSAFSQNLPQILRRHATTEDAEETIQ